MMNKKAIAAFAAGATLLAGFAMATPAFAAEPQAPKKEECKPADAAKLAELKKAVHDAERNAIKAGYDAEDSKADYDKAVAQSKAEETVVKKYNATLKQVKDALKAKTDAQAGNDDEKKESTALAYTQAKKAHDASKKAVEDYNASVTDNKLASYKVADALVAGQDVAAGTAELTFTAASRAALLEANAKKADADKALQDAKDALAKAQCTPAPAPQPGPQPVQPAQPGSKTEAIKNVLAKKVDVDAAEHNFAEKKEAYAKAAATLTAAKAELDAAEHDKAVAAQNLSDFEASGVNDSAKLKSLKEAVARADAHVVRTTNAFNKALADFNDAKTADLAAQAAYNAAKDAYDEAYNAAIKLGVNPALLPSVTAIDPLSPAFPQLAQAQKIYADALAGKFGAAAQKAVQKAEAKAQAAAPAAAAAGKAGAAAKGELATKGGNGHGKAGEKLGNAGVGVALTALAASMLAGMGAAVRKMRH
ncbi:hypothetical protein [Gardnerella vaginalis]|uniref:hypothetical protein n=1 Tax=Gardnerella vaginalis TaxID=2702 RepID=UPI0002634830|nr:hypothetical protein [Gardnerella vaginalis]EIK74254.1 hypothetical protein CGSMWGv284V_06169 [Gardnerella vaginalis 284V]